MAKVPLLVRLGSKIAEFGGAEVKSGGGYMQELLELFSRGSRSKAGVDVGLNTAMRVSCVLACARVLAEGVAGMPWKLQRRFDDGRRVSATNLPLYNVLYRTPNDWQTSFEFREMLMYHCVLTGNGYAFINRDSAGRIMELLPLVPNRVRPIQDNNLVLSYEFRTANGTVETIPLQNMMHIRGPSWDGIIGMDVVKLARESIGLAIAAEETQADLHKNGLQVSGIISMTGALNDVAQKRLRERIKEMQDESLSVLILDQAAKFEKMQMSGVDSEHLETRKFQIEEICRQFRVFPQMIGLADRGSSYASAEQFFLAHVIHSLMPWVERWEQAAHRDLLGDDSDQGDFQLVAKMSMQGLMRGDAASRAAFYASGILNGWMTRADAREFEDMPAILGIDIPLVPLNMRLITDPVPPPIAPGASPPAAAAGSGGVSQAAAA